MGVQQFKIRFRLVQHVKPQSNDVTPDYILHSHKLNLVLKCPDDFMKTAFNDIQKTIKNRVINANNKRISYII